MALDDPPPTAASRSRLRRAGAAVLVLVIALGGVVLLLLFFQSRDRSQLDDRGRDQASGPGQVFPDLGHAHARSSRPFASDPPTSGPHGEVPISVDGARLTDDQLLHAIELGDVVLLYGTPKPPPGLRALADEVAGPFDPALAAAGQAVVLGRRRGTDGIVAVAWRRLLRVRDASDPRLEEFTSFWLGRGADG